MVGYNDVVAGKRSSIVPASADLLLLPRQVRVTTATTTTMRTSRRREQGRTPMGAGNDDRMTAWHQLGGIQRHPKPTPTVGE